jgi:hypothetical protein
MTGSHKGGAPPCLVFLHIPKTAGTTLSHMIVRRFRREQIFHVRNPKFPKGPVYSENYGTVEAFQALPETERAGFRCILGHFHYGLHRWIPGPAVYVTMVRDPIERLLSQLSQYNKMIRNSEIASQGQVSLQEYLRVAPAAAENHHARFLLGVDDYDVLDAAERRSLVLTALRERFLWVGVQEQFDESVVLLHRKLGWTPLPFGRLNVSPDRTRLEDYPPETISRLRSINQLDLAVHEYAVDRLLSETRALRGFERKVRRYRKLGRWAERRPVLYRIMSMMIGARKRWSGRGMIGPAPHTA